MLGDKELELYFRDQTGHQWFEKLSQYLQRTANDK